MKHLKSLHTFTDKSVQVLLVDFEQQFNPALAITCPVQREHHPLAATLKMTNILRMNNLVGILILTIFGFNVSAQSDNTETLI